MKYSELGFGIIQISLWILKTVRVIYIVYFGQVLYGDIYILTRRHAHSVFQFKRTKL